MRKITSADAIIFQTLFRETRQSSYIIELSDLVWIMKQTEFADIVCRGEMFCPNYGKKTGNDSNFCINSDAGE